MNKSKFLASLALLPFLAFAGLVEETLTLANGWNAVYIESTPANSDATAFWVSLPVTKASCYVSSVYSATAQLASDGASIIQKPVSHLVWDANDTANSTMGQVAGGCVYVVLATNDATKTFLGTPQIPRVTWQVSDGGFCTFAPVSVPAGQSVASSVYFGEGPCGETFAAKPYSVWGDDADAPKITPKDVFSRKPQVEGVTPWIVAHQAPLSMGFPRQEYQSGLLFPFPGDLPDPGIKPKSPSLAGKFFTTEPPGKPVLW